MNKKYQKYIEYIAKDIEPPYFKSLEQYGLKQDEMDLVLSKVFNQHVTIKDDYVYDEQGNIIYFENSNGYWYKQEYNDQGNLIYYEDSDGYWYKKEYDNQGNQIYYENNDGYWVKSEYNDQGNIIYFENSNGVWKKYEYDEQGNRIYYENSNGYIIDDR
jgi:YD repeat-containing protein